MSTWFFNLFISSAVLLWLIVYILKLRSFNDITRFLHELTPRGREKLLNEYVSLLTMHSAFYVSLSPSGRKIFIKKCSDFISNKEFKGMAGLEVTHEMKIRLAATAAQVTFGLKKSSFSHFHTIKIFPESFYSGLHDNYLKGGASTGGSLMFSWQDFVIGYDDPSDRYNLGLHEMAHALRVQLRWGTDFDDRFASYSDQWEEMALPEFESMNEGNTSFLREYGGTNIEEFFAVCVEHFFEVPFEFKKQLPDIFNHLCFLLNLDPTRSEEDYKLAPGFVESVNRDPQRMPLPLKLKMPYKYASWHWSYNFILSGLFLCVPAIMTMHQYIFFNGMNIFISFLTATSFAMFFRKWLITKGIYDFQFLFFFSVVGFSPLVTVLMLVSNYYIKTSYSATAYPLSKVEVYYNEKSQTRIYSLELQNKKFAGYSHIRTFPAGSFKFDNTPSNWYLGVTVSKGLWGLENFEDKQVINGSLIRKEK